MASLAWYTGYLKVIVGALGNVTPVAGSRSHRSSRDPDDGLRTDDDVMAKTAGSRMYSCTDPGLRRSPGTSPKRSSSPLIGALMPCFASFASQIWWRIFTDSLAVISVHHSSAEKWNCKSSIAYSSASDLSFGFSIAITS